MPVYNETNKEKWTSDGRHYYFRCYYTDFKGTRKQKVSKMYKSSSDAKNAERDYLNKVSTTDIVDSNVTFEFVYNEWLEFKKKIVKSTTYYSIKKMMDKHIYNYLKNYKLHSIKLNTINDLLSQNCIVSCDLKYQNKIIGYLKEFLNYAKDNYDYDIKVVSKIQKNRIETVNKIRDSEWNFWTYEDFNKFINVVDINLWFVIFNFLYYTGLRLGEMIALSWKDIDLNKKTVKIYKNFTNKVGDNSYRIVDPKTKNSIRIVDLDDNLVSLLKKYKQEEETIIDFSNEMFVFGNVKPITPTLFATKLSHYIELSNVKKITPHGFRHSHVSLLINFGCDSRDVAERVGDTIQVVESTYYHMFPEKRSKTVNILNQIFKN